MTDPENPIVSGEWQAEWAVYGPFKKATGFKKFNPTIYWQWKIKFTDPAGEVIQRYSGEWMYGHDYFEGESSTREDAVRDAVTTANKILSAQRRKHEPVESGVITLPSAVS